MPAGRASTGSRRGLMVLAAAGLSAVACLGVVAAAALPSEQSFSPRSGDPLARGRRLLEEGRVAAAKEAFLEALKGDPNSVKALMGLAACAREVGDDEEAIRCYERVKTLDPKNVAAFRALAILYHNVGGRDFEAVSALRTAMDLAPEEEKAEMSRLMTKLLTGRSAADDPTAGFRDRPESRSFDPFPEMRRPERPDPYAGQPPLRRDRWMR